MFALASRPKEEQQDPTMPVCPSKLLNRPTGNFDTHRKGGKPPLRRAENVVRRKLPLSFWVLIMGKIP